MISYFLCKVLWGKNAYIDKEIAHTPVIQVPSASPLVQIFFCHRFEKQVHYIVQTWPHIPGHRGHSTCRRHSTGDIMITNIHRFTLSWSACAHEDWAQYLPLCKYTQNAMHHYLVMQLNPFQFFQETKFQPGTSSPTGSSAVSITKHLTFLHQTSCNNQHTRLLYTGTQHKIHFLEHKHLSYKHLTVTASHFKIVWHCLINKYANMQLHPWGMRPYINWI